MAAGKDKAKTIVGYLGRVEVWLLNALGQLGGIQIYLLVKPSLAADAVDGLMPGRLDDPGAREFRNIGCPPLVDSRRKCFLRRLFRYFEVTHEANQSGDDPAPLATVK